MSYPADYLPDPQVEAQERAYALSRLAEEEATFRFEEIQRHPENVGPTQPKERWEIARDRMEEEDRGLYDEVGRVY